MELKTEPFIFPLSNFFESANFSYTSSGQWRVAAAAMVIEYEYNEGKEWVHSIEIDQPNSNGTEAKGGLPKF